MYNMADTSDNKLDHDRYNLVYMPQQKGQLKAKQ